MRSCGKSPDATGLGDFLTVRDPSVCPCLHAQRKGRVNARQEGGIGKLGGRLSLGPGSPGTLIQDVQPQDREKHMPVVQAAPAVSVMTAELTDAPPQTHRYPLLHVIQLHPYPPSGMSDFRVPCLPLSPFISVSYSPFHMSISNLSSVYHLSVYSSIHSSVYPSFLPRIYPSICPPMCHTHTHTHTHTISANPIGSTFKTDANSITSHDFYCFLPGLPPASWFHRNLLTGFPHICPVPKRLGGSTQQPQGPS